MGFASGPRKVRQMVNINIGVRLMVQVPLPARTSLKKIVIGAGRIGNNRALEFQ